MDNLSPPETRRRSRSKTPFLRSQCDNEHCDQAGEEGHVHHERKKSPILKVPTVITILEESTTERSNTPEKQNLKIANQKKNKITTSDYSSEETSPEHGRNKNQLKTSSTTKTVVTEIRTISHGGFSSNTILNENSSYKSVNSSGHQNQSLGKLRAKEIAQNEINSAFESSSLQTSTPILTQSKKTSKVVTKNGDLNEHLSYHEYKAAGEYWNKFPKTDYTYSKLSPHRREIAPGIIAMPNMSRPSLMKHHERVNLMAERNPEQAAYIRERYEQTRYSKNISPTHSESKEAYYYDSQDEVDECNYRKAYAYQTTRKSYQPTEQIYLKKQNILVRFFTSIVETFQNLFIRSDKHLYYDQYHEEKGFLSTILSFLFTPIYKICSYVYLFISSILYMDTWLLESSSAHNKNKKRFLLLLLIMFPFLLLAGFYYILNPPEFFPPINFSEYIDQIDFNNIKMTTIEKIDDLKILSEDYYNYLKTISQNAYVEVQNKWNENFNY